MSSYYDVLGVGVDADVDEVRRAYLAKAQLLHPDRYAGGPEAERRRAESEMKVLNEAWNTLKSAEARQRYDLEYGFWNDEVWDEEIPTGARPSLFRRTGVRVAVVAVVVAGLAGSGIAVLAGRDTRSRSPSKSTAGSWSATDSADLRSAAIRAGLTPTRADCFVGYITSRYRPSDEVDPSVIQRAADACP